jgi:membrane protein DedA with SNARE-associated domain
MVAMRGIGLIAVLTSAGLFSSVLDTLTGLIMQYGYPAVFAAAFFEVIFPPIPSEVIFPLVGFTAQSEGLGLGNAIGMAVVGALGSTIGAIVIYFVAMRVGRAAIVKFGRRIRVGEHEIERAEQWFRRYGPVAVFTARMVPGIREIISIPAGIGKMNLGRFTTFTFAGSLVWCIALTLAGYYLGEAWSMYSEQVSSAFTIVSIIVIAGLAAVMGVWYSRRKNAATKERQ